jgi:hypothetical protein
MRITLSLAAAALLAQGCSVSVTEKVSSDVARAFVEAGYVHAEQPNRYGLGNYMLAQPAIRNDLIDISDSLGYTAGRALARMCR